MTTPEGCVICTGPVARDGLCQACLRMRAFSKNAPKVERQTAPLAPAAVIAGSPRIAQIQEIVREAFDMRLSAMTSKRRTREIARPRQIAMYLAREMTGASTTVIGRMFGGRDHTTVMHAERTIRDMIEHDIEFAALVETLRQRAQLH